MVRQLVGDFPLLTCGSEDGLSRIRPSARSRPSHVSLQDLWTALPDDSCFTLCGSSTDLQGRLRTRSLRSNAIAIVTESPFEMFLRCLGRGPLRAVKAIARSQWNGGFGVHCGPSQGDPCTRALRPIATSTLASSDGRFTSTPAGRSAQTVAYANGVPNWSNRRNEAFAKQAPNVDLLAPRSACPQHRAFGEPRGVE